MWKDYSLEYMKKNKAASITILVSALIAAFFISLLSGIFYNMWTDEIRQITQKEGDWQGRLTGDFTEEDLSKIESYFNVERVILSEDKKGKYADIYLYQPRRVYEDLPVIAGQIGLEIGKGGSGIQYHNTLLTRYFIYSPEEKKDLPMLLTVYLCFLLVSCFSLVMIIHNAFGISMNARMHQLGILQSVGATPKQILAFLMQEAFVLCVLPVLAGIAAGAGVCRLFLEAANQIGVILQIQRASNNIFSFPPGLILLVLAACLVTVGISAWIPARRLSKMTPLEAIRGCPEPFPENVKKYSILTAWMGAEGDLAQKSLYVRRKSMRTSSLSLTLALLAFTAYLNFDVMSYISTYHTFFERYKDTWDFMVTFTGEEDGTDLVSGIRQIPGLSSCVAYKKAEGYMYLSDDDFSTELKALGGLEGLKNTGIVKEEGGYPVKVPLVILDDESFESYCLEAGIDKLTGTSGGVVVLNKIWDNINSHFKEPRYIPFVKENKEGLLILYPGRNHMEVMAYTAIQPDLREQYDDFSLVQIIPESLYKGMEGSFEIKENCLQIRADTDGSIDDVQVRLEKLLVGTGEYLLENRKNEEVFNEVARFGYRIIMGGLCGILALIGLSNVFSNTLGTISQRKKEFVRYLSVGMTPGGVKKVLFTEALLVAGKPVLISLFLNIPFVAYCIQSSKILFSEYLERIPVLPIAVFVICVFAAVGLAYYLGGRSILRSKMSELLKDDTLY